MNRRNYKFEDDKVSPIREYKKKYRDNSPLLSPESYFYDYKNLEKRQQYVEFESTFTLIC